MANWKPKGQIWPSDIFIWYRILKSTQYFKIERCFINITIIIILKYLTFDEPNAIILCESHSPHCWNKHLDPSSFTYISFLPGKGREIAVSPTVNKFYDIKHLNNHYPFYVLFGVCLGAD